VKLFAIVTVILLPAFSLTQTATDPLVSESYIEPPKLIADIIKSPRHENVSLSNLDPNGQWFCVNRSAGMATLKQTSSPYVRLAGQAFDVSANRDRALTFRGYTGFQFFSTDGRKVELSAPRGFRFWSPTWSPDGTKLAYIAFNESHNYLGVYEVAKGNARMLSRTSLLPTLAANLIWTDNGKSVACVQIPASRPPAPTSSLVPTQPRVKVSEPSKNKSRPLRGLLETSSDQQLLEHLATGQLTKIDVETGKSTAIGSPGMIDSFSAATDGTAFRITQIFKPFSYVVPFGSFSRKETLIDLTGKVIYEISDRKLQLGGIDAPSPAQTSLQPSKPDAKRDIKWRPDGIGISFLQKEPAPPKKEGEIEDANAKRKDRLMQWVAPYGESDVKVVYEQDEALTSVQFSPDCKYIFVSRTKGTATEQVVIELETKKATVISSSKREDFYENPGTLVSGRVSNTILVSSTGYCYLRGTQYFKDNTKDAPRPFLDRVSLADGKKERLWQSSENSFENIVSLLDSDAEAIVISRESPTQVSSSLKLDLVTKTETSLVSNRDFAPDVTAAQRFRIRIMRADGISFWAKVTLPKWWVPGGKLPAFFWFYPSEFVDQKAIDDGARTYNKNLFPSVSSLDAEMFTLLGYAVVEPECPIVGPADRKNDSYIPDLRNNLSATIDELDKRGFIDRSKLALGGHSYGAFSTVNAMAHTPFFKAGIAGDGAYLRPLTPMAFQSENRTLWEAREMYLEMSPLLYAERFTGALLMYHGLDDQNPGTNPINSERLFNALDGLGKTVSLYMYPYEDHSPAAQETILDIWARWVAWLEKYVKSPLP
jgi:dipeptidyl aminopeptidase/acylaminoacyl peptidase